MGRWAAVPPFPHPGVRAHEMCFIYWVRLEEAVTPNGHYLSYTLLKERAWRARRRARRAPRDVRMITEQLCSGSLQVGPGVSDAI